MFKLILCDYSNVYILVKGTISIAPLLPQAVNPNKSNKEVLFKNFALFTDCISKINNTQRYNAKDIDVVMPMYNLQNVAIIIYKHQEFYGNTIEINHF